MPEKTYLIHFHESEIGPKVIRASHVEIYGDHLAFVQASGELSALVLFDIVKNWSEIDT